MIEHIDIEAALAREMQLLADTAFDPHQSHVLFWTCPQALVVPRVLSKHPDFTAARARLAREGWPISVRSTGGDVTPQGPGIVNVSLIYAPSGPPDVAASYDRLCAPIEHCLGPGASRGWNPGAFCDGAYNVQLNGWKFAGTAQRFKACPGQGRSAVLSHALMLIKPPSKASIEALNLLLTLIDQPRRIDPEAHTGLPAGRGADGFLDDLKAAYTDRLR